MIPTGSRTPSATVAASVRTCTSWTIFRDSHRLTPSATRSRVREDVDELDVLLRFPTAMGVSHQ